MRTFQGHSGEQKGRYLRTELGHRLRSGVHGNSTFRSGERETVPSWPISQGASLSIMGQVRGILARCNCSTGRSSVCGWLLEMDWHALSPASLTQSVPPHLLRCLGPRWRRRGRAR